MKIFIYARKAERKCLYMYVWCFFHTFLTFQKIHKTQRQIFAYVLVRIKTHSVKLDSLLRVRSSSACTKNDFVRTSLCVYALLVHAFSRARIRVANRSAERAARWQRPTGDVVLSARDAAVIKKEIHQRVGGKYQVQRRQTRGGRCTAAVKVFMPHDESLLESRRIL